MLIFKILKKGIKVFFVALFFLKSHAVFGATTYTLLEQLSSEMGPSPTLGVYLTEMFKLGIGIASVLAVLKIIIGGIKYMTAEAVGVKTEAKITIQNAIFGLILALASWLLLNTINTDLINVNLNLTPVSYTDPTTGNWMGTCEYDRAGVPETQTVSGDSYNACNDNCLSICTSSSLNSNCVLTNSKKQ